MHDPTTPILDVRAASFRYRGSRFSLDAVDLTVHRGDVVALLGHNGSGKSTLLRSVFDLLRLRDGEIAICGISNRRESAKTSAMLLSGNEHLPIFITGRELIRLLGRMYACHIDDARVDELFSLYGMTGRQDDIMEDYSHGMRTTPTECGRRRRSSRRCCCADR